MAADAALPCRPARALLINSLTTLVAEVRADLIIAPMPFEGLMNQDFFVERVMVPDLSPGV
jgi:hypothetical protein